MMYNTHAEHPPVFKRAYNAIRTSVSVAPEKTKSIELCDVLRRIDALRGLGENWNGYSVAAPSPTSIARAEEWVEGLYRDASSINRLWLTPHVASDEDGNVVLEWNQGDKELTVYILPDSVNFIRVPSENEDEIEAGKIITDTDRRNLWRWLTN